MIIVLSFGFSFQYWTSLKNRFASIGSARAVFSELVNRLFQAVRVETVSPEGFLSGCRGISFWGSYKKHLASYTFVAAENKCVCVPHSRSRGSVDAEAVQLIHVFLQRGRIHWSKKFCPSQCACKHPSTCDGNSLSF